jgi:hypothetical protein
MSIARTRLCNQIVAFLAISHVLSPWSDSYEGYIPVGALMVRLLTGVPNADLYSWEYKGGACKSVIRRVMCKPYSSPCMLHVSAVYFACVHISFWLKCYAALEETSTQCT